MNISQENVQLIIGELLEVFEPEQIYLFGSANKGNFCDNSDIDIGFYTSIPKSSYEVWLVAQSLASKLSRDIDLIDLRETSTVFKAQILGNGELIYSNNREKQLEFAMRAFKEYAFLNEERAEILARIQQEGKVYE